MNLNLSAEKLQFDVGNFKLRPLNVPSHITDISELENISYQHTSDMPNAKLPASAPMRAVDAREVILLSSHSSEPARPVMPTSFFFTQYLKNTHRTLTSQNMNYTETAIVRQFHPSAIQRLIPDLEAFLFLCPEELNKLLADPSCVQRMVSSYDFETLTTALKQQPIMTDHTLYTLQYSTEAAGKKVCTLQDFEVFLPSTYLPTMSHSLITQQLLQDLTAHKMMSLESAHSASGSFKVTASKYLKAFRTQQTKVRRLETVDTSNLAPIPTSTLCRALKSLVLTTRPSLLQYFSTNGIQLPVDAPVSVLTRQSESSFVDLKALSFADTNATRFTR